MRGKSSGDRRLIEACRQRGCPVCRRVRDESRSHLHALIHEHVTDVETRRELRASWGLCNWHTWMLLEVDTGVLGASILSEDLLREAIDRVAQLPDRSRRRGLATWLGRSGTAGGAPALVAAHHRRPRCPLCVTAARTERQCLLTFVKSIDDAELVAAYDASDPLCLPHLVRAIELTPGSRELRRLVERTREKWRAIRETLRSFIDKHDYRKRSAYTDAEASSYVRAFEILAGANGLFGNDLAGARHRARGGRHGD
jgi:hypothetical protein